MAKVRSFMAEVEYRDNEGHHREERFPLWERGYGEAQKLALGYVLRVLKLSDFELRLIGS